MTENRPHRVAGATVGRTLHLSPEAILVEDPLEFRLVRAFREAPLKARLSLLEVMETLASQRTGRTRPHGTARTTGSRRS